MVSGWVRAAVNFSCSGWSLGGIFSFIALRLYEIGRVIVALMEV